MTPLWVWLQPLGVAAAGSTLLRSLCSPDVCHNLMRGCIGDPNRCRALFKTHPLEQSIENQWSFLAQRFGGPQLFTELKGGEPG